MYPKELRNVIKIHPFVSEEHSKCIQHQTLYDVPLNKRREFFVCSVKHVRGLYFMPLAAGMLVWGDCSPLQNCCREGRGGGGRFIVLI
jgi:hypothetical protein